MLPLTTAVIGVGYLGKYHADKYAQLPQSQLVAIADVDSKARETFSEKYAIPTFSDYRSLLGKVKAVSIATPTPLHFPIASFFLDHGVHVLIEKPITSTLTEAEELIQLAKKRNCILQVGHLERFNPALLAVQPHLHHPRFIESVRVAPFQLRGLDVNVILDLMIHDIDIIQSIVNSPIRHIHANGTPILSNDTDIANARIEFHDGCVANVTASRVSFKSERKMRIFQEHSYLSLDFQNASFILCKKGKSISPSGMPEILREEFQFENKDALLAEINSFLNAILHQTPSLVSGEEGKHALETAIQISKLVKSPTFAFA